MKQQTDDLPRRARGARVRGFGLFLYLWVMIGFTLGTFALLGPVRWITSSFRASDTASAVENAVVIAIILMLGVASALMARALARASRRGRSPVSRGLFPGLATLAAGLCVWLWFTPRFVAGSAVDENAPRTVVQGAKASFVFGPYPDKEALAQLKREGFDGVITLLHPAVVPFEPKILRDERNNAREVGMPLIHAPMLPWVKSNDASLRIVRGVAEDSTGKYYVHCYLGRDRVLVVQRVIEHTGALAASGRDPARVALLADGMAWQRGPVHEIEDELYLTPPPADTELRRYLAGGAVRQVVAILDSLGPAERALIDEARTSLGAAGVPLTVWPIRPGAGDWDNALRLAKHMYELPRPLAVYGAGAEPGDSFPLRIWLEAMKSLRPGDSESGRVITGLLEQAAPRGR